MNNDQLLEQIKNYLTKHNQTMSTAESCTGGMIASVITDMNGCSQWFDRGYVSYSNQSKIELLKVKSKTLKQFGAVSEEVVLEMVKGCLIASKCHVALSITGIAGPGGGTKNKPVGTVWFAWAKFKANKALLKPSVLKTASIKPASIKPMLIKSELKHFSGSRDEVREQSVHYSLVQLHNFLIS